MENSSSIITQIISAKKAYSKLIAKKWVVILLSCLIGLTSATYVYFQDSVYTATETFFTDNDKGGKIGGYASLASQFGIDLNMGSDGAYSGENLMALMRSRLMVKKTLYSKIDAKSNTKLIEVFIKNHQLKKYNGRTGAVDLRQTNFFNIDDKRLQDSILNLIIDDIQKNKLIIDKVDRKADMYFISYTDNNEEFAKSFTENIVQNVVENYLEYKTGKTRSSLAIIQHQADSVREKLYGGITNVAQLNDLNVNPLKQQLRSPTQIKQSEMQVNTVLYTELLKNLQIAQLTLKKETPLMQIIDSPASPLQNKKMGRAVAAIIGSFFGGIFFSIIFFLFYFFSEQKKIKSLQAA